MSDLILVPLSAGELFDKITILEIKRDKIKDSLKLHNVARELEVLKSHASSTFPVLEESTSSLIRELHHVNSLLWDIEDEIRDYERRKIFDAGFIKLARSVYIENDRRARLKREVNIELKSYIVEEKSYRDY